jgi:hypothetical protein
LALNCKLEGNSQIIKKTLTLSSGVLLDGYFYDPILAIYSQKSDEYPLNSIKSHLLSRVLTNVSDLNVLDKLYLYYKISSLRASNTNLYIDELGQNAVTYNAALRSERKLVQILYSKDYKSMFLLAKVLELTGVRVPDLTQNSETFLGRCQILENSPTPSITAIYLKNYFNCTYQKQDLGLYEIVFKTGQQLENEWKVSK